MTHRASINSSASSARTWPAAALAIALALAHAAPALACGAEDLDIAGLTTFDPHVLGPAVWDGLYYDPSHGGFGGPCEACPVDEMLADWSGWLGPQVSHDDWKQVLLSADLKTIDALIFTLQKKKAAVPKAYQKNSVLKADPAKSIAALYFVGFARRVEPFGVEAPESWDTPGIAQHAARLKKAGDPAVLQVAGEKQLTQVEDPFLRQRYAFQLLRLRFHRRDWPAVVAYHKEAAALLDGPSAALRWRARHYLAGALRRSGQVAQANLELMRIFVAFPPLAGAVAHDFKPLEDKDWKACLALASSPAEKAALWQLVGLKLDPLGALGQVSALDPSGERAALLVVRELARSESDAAALAKLEPRVVKLAASPSTQRRWVFELVGAHLAALRGDLAETRARLTRAAQGAPAGDALITKQRSATLAIALAASWKADPKLEDELAAALVAVGPDFSRADAVRAKVAAMIRPRLLAAGRRVEAELFGSEQPYAARLSTNLAPLDPATLEGLIARLEKPVTALDKVLVSRTSHTRASLFRDLGVTHVLRGEFEAAHKAFATTPAASARLGTDPFVMRVVDCHDCDHAQYGPTSTWTHARFATRLRDLKAQAAGTGEPAARAALELGIGLYNLTHYGNARSVTEGTPAATFDTAPAEAAFRRAFELTRDKELKAQAAYMAAKCELAQQLSSPEEEPIDPVYYLPIPQRWFAELTKLGETKYHAEVLGECGHYRRWRALAAAKK